MVRFILCTSHLNWSVHMLSDKDQRECLERLAKRMRIQTIPDVVAGNLPEDSLRFAFATNDEDYWEELERETRRLLTIYHAGSGAPASPPSRDERGVPQEVEVEVSEYGQKRARAFSEVATA